MLLKTNIEERSGKTFVNENFIWFFKGKTLENMVNHEIPEEDFSEKQLNSFKKLESALSVIGLDFLLFLCRTENLIIQWASENVLTEIWHVFNIYYSGIGAS